MPSVSTTRDIVCASNYSSNSNGWPLFIAFFVNTGDVKYIKFERKGGDKKNGWSQRLACTWKLYISNMKTFPCMYTDFCASFLASNSLVLQYIPNSGEKNDCLVFVNVSNNPRKLQTICARNQHILSIWKRELCFIYAAHEHLSSQLIVVGQLA